MSNYEVKIGIYLMFLLRNTQLIRKSKKKSAICDFRRQRKSSNKFCRIREFCGDSFYQS